MEDLDEAVLRTDITRTARGFAYKKFLGKDIADVKKAIDPGAKKKVRYHSTMEDGRKVYHGVGADGHHHFSIVGHDGTVEAHVNATKDGKSHAIEMTVAKPGAGVHKLYHHLITKHNHILTSKEQSGGGLAVWQRMRKMGGVNVHGFHPKTGKAQHVDIVHRPELSHVSHSELEKFRKTKGGTAVQRKKEYADLKKTQSMMVVAHKNRNIRPMKSRMSECYRTITRVIREAVGIESFSDQLLEATGKSIHYFDVDKTLMHTDSTRVHVLDPAGKKVASLDPQEYNHHKLPHGHSYDYSEFRSADKFDKAKPIRKMLAKMKAIKKMGGKTEILTARSDFDNKDKFAKTWKKFGVDISPGNTHVRRAGNIGLTTHHAKAKIISDAIKAHGYKEVHLYDDHKTNIDAMLDLKKHHPEVTFHGHHVEHKPDGMMKITRYKA
jgi:hypothetical protein